MTGKPRKPKDIKVDLGQELSIGDIVYERATGSKGEVTQILQSGAIMANIGGSQGSRVVYLTLKDFEVKGYTKEESIKYLYSCIEGSLIANDKELFLQLTEKLKVVSASRYELAVIEDKKKNEEPVVVPYNRKRELEIVMDLFLEMGNTQLAHEYSESISSEGRK